VATPAVSVRVAGDLNRDGRVDALDSALWEAEPTAAAPPTSTVTARATALDRQILFANNGFTGQPGADRVRPAAAAALVDLGTDLSANLAYGDQPTTLKATCCSGGCLTPRTVLPASASMGRR
jgi:hypothetical protein